MSGADQMASASASTGDTARLRELIECAEHILYRVDFSRGAYDYISTSASQMLGVSMVELHEAGLRILRERMPEADYARCVAHFRRIAELNPGRTTRTQVEYRLTLADGRLAHFVDACSVQADERGEPVVVCGIVTDVSDQKRTQQMLVESSRLLADFFAQSLDGCFVLRFPEPVDWSARTSGERADMLASLVFLRINEAFAKQCGSTVPSLLGQSAAAIPCREREALRDAIAASLDHGHCLTSVELSPSGAASVWVEMQLLADLDDAGCALGVFGVQRDVTEKLEQQRALLESDEKYSATMRSAQVGIFMLQDQRFVFVNPRLSEYFGYSEDELLAGMGPLDLVVQEEHDWLIDQMRRRAAGEPGAPYELTGRRRDGSRFPILILGSPASYRGCPASVGTVLDMTTQRRVEAEILASRNRYRALFEGAQDAIIVVDGESGKVVESNVEAELLFRRPRELLTGLDLTELFPEERRERYARLFRHHLVVGGGEPEEMRIISADGERIPVEVSTSVIETAGGRKSLQGIFRNIAARRRAEEGLRLAQRVFDVSEEVIIITDKTGAIIAVNPAFTRVTGYSGEEVIGLQSNILRSGRQPPEFYAAMWDAIRNEGVWQGELWNRRKSGEVYPAWLTISVYRDAEGEVLNYVGISSDISERHAAEARIRELAYFDPLTKLPNRALLHDRVDQVLAKAERTGGMVALLFVDLDHFKTINDSLGHFTGDRLLCEVGERMSACVRRADTVSRLGGDEFVIVIADSGMEGAAEVARKLLESVAKPYRIDAHDLRVTPSIGISLYPQDGQDFQTLLKHADTAMYRAKESGRNAYQFFAREMNVAALERLVLESSLRVALEKGEFFLHYQPQIELASGRIIGAEALIRWRHPQIGVVSPAKFIPVAESSGLIVPLGAWVLREACRQAASWQQEGMPAIRMAVNISAVQFRQQGFEHSVSETLAATGLAPEFLELEMTESAVMEDAESTVRMLQRLAATGLRLSIDDFGTGYSSLSYLKRFPIDKLKIDQSFVRDIVTDADDWAIASTIISMGRGLRLHVIAEGVETAAQLEMLERQGCASVQGYHFSRPLSAEDFAAMLRQQPFIRK